MKNKKTIDEAICARQVKVPNRIVYNLLGRLWKALFFKRYGVKVTFNFDFRKEKGAYIFISNHTSRMDYIFNSLPLLPNTYNFVIGYNEFYRGHLATIFKILNTIPKKNFVADNYAVTEMNRILKSGGRLFLFPEGMNSISGANQPVATGTGKFIKHYKLPVYYSVIKGGYLTCPKYAEDERPGTVEVVYDRMFTSEELNELTPEQIEDIMNEKLYHDDFKWNKERGYTYKTNGKAAENLHDLLFWCPKCGSQFTMLGKGDKIVCSRCGNGAELDEAYNMHPLDETCVIPETQTEWFKLEREVIKKEIADENFSFSANVKLGTLPKYELIKDSAATSLIAGEGILTIDRSGLTYNGTRDGQPYTFHIESVNLPTYGMCTDMSRFYTFYKGEFVEFYPETRCVEKFFIATEELHRLTGGKWKDFKFADKL